MKAVDTGSGNKAAIEQMLQYARETKQKKSFVGALAVSLTMFGQERRDTLIETMTR